jgi:SRSO17 transposase
VPKAWPNDQRRCARAGRPAAQTCATTPQLAQQRLKRAFDAGVPAAWGTGASVYGENRPRRMWWEEQEDAHGLAGSGQAYVWRAGRPQQGTTILTPLGAEGWGRWSVGDGAKGPRGYDWRWLPLATPWQPHWRRWLLVHRSLRAPTALTADVVFAPHTTTLATVGQVAGSRWTMERSCAEAKGDVGRDHYAVRSWPGW